MHTFYSFRENIQIHFVKGNGKKYHFPTFDFRYYLAEGFVYRVYKRKYNACAYSGINSLTDSVHGQLYVLPG